MIYMTIYYFVRFPLSKTFAVLWKTWRFQIKVNDWRNNVKKPITCFPDCFLSVSKSSGCFCQDLCNKKHFSPGLPFWLKSFNLVTTLGVFFRWIQKRILDLMNPFWKRIHWIWNPKNPNPDCKRISDLRCSIHSWSKISQMIQWYFSSWSIPVKFPFCFHLL